jgi:hypothetical protein
MCKTFVYQFSVIAKRKPPPQKSKAAVQATARAEWPEAMKREMQACRTAEQHRLWSERWALHLAGSVMAERPSSGGRIAGGGCQPS